MLFCLYHYQGSCIKRLGFNLDFHKMNHIIGPDIVSPNGDNTHHGDSNVS